MTASAWRIRRKQCAAAMALVLCAVAAGCGGVDEKSVQASTSAVTTAPGNDAPPQKQKAVRFVLPAPPGADFALYYVADSQFGAENGVKLKFDTQLVSTQGAKLIMQGRADAYVGITTVLAVINDAGLPLKYFRDDFVRNLTGFAVPADSDIHSIEDLRGKTIGLVDPGWTVVWDPIMRAAGMKPGDYEYKIVGVGHYKAMALGQVDAVASWAMNWQSPDAGLQKLRYLPGKVLDPVARTPSNGIMVSAEVVEQAPSWLVGLGRAVSQAQDFLKANPECAAKIVREYAPSKDAMDVTLAQVTAQIEYQRNAATEEHGLGYNDPAAFDYMLDEMRAGGVIKQPLKAADISDNSLIDEFNDYDRDAVLEKARSCQI